MWCSPEQGRWNFVIFCLVFSAIWDGVVFHYASGAVAQTSTFPRAANTSQAKPTSGYHLINYQSKRRRNKGHIFNFGCVGITIRRYVSNGFCTSRKPIRDMLCQGQCMAMEDLPWFPHSSKIFSRRKHEWHCVRDQQRTRKVKVFCNDGSSALYRIRVVRSCKCRNYNPQYNRVRFPMDIN